MDKSVLRSKIGDEENRDIIIDRLNEASRLDNKEDITWHKSCYSSFTSQSNIYKKERKKSRNKSDLSKDESSANSTSGASTSKPLRSTVNPTNWNACFFCHDNECKTKLSSVSTFKMSEQIITNAQYDYKLSVQISGIRDLIAQEAKYHAPCYMKFMRKTNKVKGESDQPDFAMISLCDELQHVAGNGHSLQLIEIWTRYCDLAKEKDTNIPQSYFSRRATFKAKLVTYVSDVYDFIVLRSEAIENRQTVLVPTKFTHIPISEMINKDDVDLKIPLYSPDDGFLEMVHVALRLRSDILSHPQYKGLNVGEDEAISCVPESVYMFIRLLLGGQSLLDQDLDEVLGESDLEEDQSSSG